MNLQIGNEDHPLLGGGGDRLPEFCTEVIITNYARFTLEITASLVVLLFGIALCFGANNIWKVLY